MQREAIWTWVTTRSEPKPKERASILEDADTLFSIGCLDGNPVRGAHNILSNAIIRGNEELDMNTKKEMITACSAWICFTLARMYKIEELLVQRAPLDENNQGMNQFLDTMAEILELDEISQRHSVIRKVFLKGLTFAYLLQDRPSRVSSGA